MFSHTETILADVNDDSTIDAKDALDILKFAVNKISVFTAGNFTNCQYDLLGIYQDTPYMYCQNGIDETTAPSQLYEHMIWREDNFAAYRTILATPRNVRAIVSGFEEYANGKEFTVEYCDPYTLFDLVRQSGQGTVIQ